MKYIHAIAVSLVVVGFSMIVFARYKIRTICEKYPVEIQMRDFPACIKYGGPWPQKTNRITGFAIAADRKETK